MYEVELLNRTAPKVNTIELHSIMLYPFLIFLGAALVLFVLTIIISAIVREKLSARTRKKPLASVKYGEYGKNCQR